LDPSERDNEGNSNMNSLALLAILISFGIDSLEIKMNLN